MASLKCDFRNGSVCSRAYACHDGVLNSRCQPEYAGTITNILMTDKYWQIFALAYFIGWLLSRMPKRK